MADTSYPQAQYRRLEKNAVFPCIAYGAWTVEATAKAPAGSHAQQDRQSLSPPATEQVRMIPFVLAANPDTN
jgi:hypothetical protein